MNALVAKDRLDLLATIKYGPTGKRGWGTALYERYGYYTPDDHYEAAVDSLVLPGTDWIDVGGGHDIFPSNPRLATELAARCRRVVAVDPSENVHRNPFVRERHQAFLEDFNDAQGFSLATIRMVVEHVANPEKFTARLGELVRPGGKAVVMTVNRWAPVTLISASTPMWFHHFAKSILWKAKEEDTFPVVYKMNTRGRLRGLFEHAGFREVHFQHMDDCRVLARWKATQQAELMAWKLLSSVGLHYPETCLLGVYERV